MYFFNKQPTNVIEALNAELERLHNQLYCTQVSIDETTEVEDAVYQLSVVITGQIEKVQTTLIELAFKKEK